VKKLLGEFRKLAEAGEKAQEKAESDRTGDEQKALTRWRSFVTQFNKPLKEGLYSDWGNRDELIEIIRFKSTAGEGSGDNWTGLAEYVQRMRTGQKSVYYIAGSDESTLRSSPLLEAYKVKNFEVLILPDEIDDIVIGSYGKYKDFDLKPVNRAGTDDELGIDKKDGEAQEKNAQPVIDKLKTALGERVKDVRFSRRLSESPACIVLDENDPSVQMERMMKAMGQPDIPEVKLILEVNAGHPLVASLKGAENKAHIEDVAQVLLGQALLVEGRELKDSADFVKRLNRLLQGV
jgi:molecular chaperone HtpG